MYPTHFHGLQERRHDQKKATQWVGTSVGLQDAHELGHIYFLLGKPSKNRHRKAYDRAKKLLDRAPISHDLIEENDVPKLVDRLEAILGDEK